MPALATAIAFTTLRRQTDDRPCPSSSSTDTKSRSATSERLNGIQAAARAGVEIPHYCWHPGLIGRGQLPHVPGRDGHAGCRRPAQITMLPQAGARLPDAGHRRHGVRHQQREGEAGPGDGRRRSAARSSDRLPDLRQGGRVLLCRTITSSTAKRERRADIKPFTSRRRDMGDTVTLFVDRCVMCTRCVRFTREITGTSELMVDQPRQPRRDRRLPRLSAGQQAVGQRRRSVPGRRAGRQGFSVQAARLVHEAARGRLRRLLDGLLDRRRGEPGHGLSPQAAREPARQPVVDVRRRPLRLSPRASPERQIEPKRAQATTARLGMSSGRNCRRS